jgi:hypothetical protein
MFNNYTLMKYHEATYSDDDEPEREIHYPGSGNFWNETSELSDLD